MRIAVITSSYPRYLGDATAPFVQSICEHLAKLGHDIEVVAPYDPEVIGQKNQLVPVHRFRYIWPSRFHLMGHARSLESDLHLRLSAFILLPFYLIGSYITSLRITAKQKSQVIYAHWVLPNGLVAALVAWVRKVPLIISLHGSDIYVAKSNPLFRRISRWIFSKTDAVTACSPDLMRDALLLGAPQQNTILLPWGADPNIFTPDLAKPKKINHDSNKVLVASVGRLVNKKGFQVLIEAISRVIQEYRDIHLILGGDGPQKGQLVYLSDTLGIKTNVSFAGRIPWDRMPEFLANLDIFVLPSIRDELGNVDGLPTVLLEAMGSGVAVIASDIGGTSLVISPGDNGLLVPPGDAEALSQAILQLINDVGLRQNLSKSARNSVVEHYNWGAVAQQIIELIDQL